MVVFTIEDLERVMKQPQKIRNLSVIAHVDHGKSTLTDSLFAGTGVIRMDQAGTRRLTDTREDEAARCITIKSTGVSLLFPESENIPETLINLIDSPGHVDFSSEVTAALRATDGAFVVVDCVEGVCVQTETVLRQALQERVKPVLIINKLDRLFLELQCELEEMYKRIYQVIESVNVIISTYQYNENDDYFICPMKGNVAFTAGIMGWGFTLNQFATFYSSKLKKDPKSILKNFWGDRFVNKTSPNKWTSKLPSDILSQNCEWSRGFCEYILKPIRSIFEACSTDQTNWESLNKVIQRIGIELDSEQKQLTKKNLIKAVMQRWIPAHFALLELAITHLPSPVDAQKYRVDSLYSGPLDDITAEAIRNCDPEGPLTIYISKMAPEKPNDPQSRFLGFGRVFSGNISAGDQVRILGPSYEPGKKVDLFENVSISRICSMIPKPTTVSNICAGNIIAILGLDKYISKNGTLTNNPSSCTIKNMVFSVAPVVKRAVEPAKAKDLPKLVQCMKQLASSDNLVVCTVDSKTGEYIIAGAGELHLEICLNDLQRYMGECKINIKEPVVSYCETVVAESSIPCLAKSPNHHNRLIGKAAPLPKPFVEEILAGTVECNPNKISKHLQTEYEWDANDAKNVWCFSPSGGNKANLLLNATKGIQNMHEIKDSCVAALEWVANEGVLAQEPMQGIRFAINDCVLHADTIHRGGNQMIPAARRLLYACQLTASPRLLEPIYFVEITCPRHAVKGCYSSIMKRRGEVLEEVPRERSNLVVVKAYLPVAESFGFDSALRSETGGEAFPTMIFHHWKLVEGDPLKEGTFANKIVKQIRHRKGLPAQLPTLDDYLDKL